MTDKIPANIPRPTMKNPMPEEERKMLESQQPRNRDLANAVQKVGTVCNALIDEVNKVIVGKRRMLELVMVDILAQGNVLFEDYPGLAKSLTVSTFAQASGADFRRIQFTPDLLPSDITGIYMYNQKKSEFEFRPGPVFTNFLLADEINRAPPKTQAALLETMQERQVTVEGTTHVLQKPYIVLATQNPSEQEGTYPLPEAQLDRFMLKLASGYPNFDEEVEILRRRASRGKDNADVRAVTNPEQIVQMQKICEKIYVDDEILEYICGIIIGTRKDPRVYVGSSPRGSQALFKLARAQAVLKGRDYVIPDDVKSIVMPSISHRIILRPEPRIKGVTADMVMADILKEVPVPKV